MSCAAKYNLTGCDAYKKGTTFEAIVIELQDENGARIDVTGWSGQSQIRSTKDEDIYVDGTLTFNPTLGTVTISFVEKDLNELEPGFNYEWDAILKNSLGIKDSFIEGLVEIRQGATRWQS